MNEAELGLQSKDAAGGVKEFLTFALGKEEYAVDILKVQEIRGYDTVTPIANTPVFIKGVINLRGNIVPIVDLRLKFNLDTPTYNELTVVIILNIAERIVGIVVDGVSDVIALKPDQIKPAPDFSATLDTKYLRGLASMHDKMLILVDIEELLRSRDLALFDDLTSRSSALAS